MRKEIAKAHTKVKNNKRQRVNINPVNYSQFYLEYHFS